MIVVLIAIGLVSSVTTIVVGYMIGPTPLGFIGWLLIGFLCFIELLLCIIGINALVGRKRRKRPSGAVLLITYGVVFVYAGVGLTSIILYSVVRPETGAGDRSFLAILLAETVLAFIIVTIFYAYDLFLASASETMIRARDHDLDSSRTVRGILAALSDLVLSNEDLLARRERLVKKLSKAETALAHSHGGGVGSREGGWQHPDDSEAVAAADDAIRGLDGTSTLLAGEDEEGLARRFDDLERLTARLADALRRMELT
jgi:hypothetical protein